ncbi:MAG TPA: hypothetical protein VF746_01205 [Longimicrobium sp.]|jgi:hypothetical protein
MKKLKLDIDDLKIESFDTIADRASSGIGTVHGRYTDAWTACGNDGCVTMAETDCGTNYQTQCLPNCGYASMQADPWGCTAGDTCDNCGPTNMVDCSWDAMCTMDDTCYLSCESCDDCRTVGVC